MVVVLNVFLESWSNKSVKSRHNSPAVTYLRLSQDVPEIVSSFRNELELFVVLVEDVREHRTVGDFL